MGTKLAWTEAARGDVRAIEQPVALRILKTLAPCALAGEGGEIGQFSIWEMLRSVPLRFGGGFPSLRILFSSGQFGIISDGMMSIDLRGSK